MATPYPPGAFSEGDRVRIVSDNNPSSGNYTNLRGQLVAYTFSNSDDADLVIAERSLVLKASLTSPPSTNNVVYFLRKTGLRGPNSWEYDPEAPQLRAKEVITHNCLLTPKGKQFTERLYEDDHAVVAPGTKMPGRDFSGRTVRIASDALSWSGARKADSSKLKEGSDLMISYRVETLKLVPFFTTVRSSHTFRHDELELI